MPLFAVRRAAWAVALVVAWVAAPAAPAAPAADESFLDYEVALRLDPAQARFEAEVALTLRDLGPREPALSLGPGIEPDELRLDGEPLAFDRTPVASGVRLRPGHRRRLDGAHELRLSYRGPLREAGPGAFRLAPGDGWYPVVAGLPLRPRFRLVVDAPAGWQALIGGELLSREPVAGGTRATYRAAPPGGLELRLARWSRFEQRHGGVTLEAYLTRDDAAAATALLDRAARLLVAESGRSGPLPGSRIVFVEHGPDPSAHAVPGIVGLPPRFDPAAAGREADDVLAHGILHRYWGDAVEVDPGQGDWSEGLVGYLVAHAPARGEGLAAAWRRERCLRYTRFLERGGNEVPLLAPASRRSAVSADRAAMVFHMLRRRLGTERFEQALREMLRERAGRAASWDDWQRVFSRSAGEDLGWFFRQWVARPGAPRLDLAQVSLGVPRPDERDDPEAAPGGAARFEIRGELRQTPGTWRLRVPVAIETGRQIYRRTFDVASRATRFRIGAPGPPEVLWIDPDHDLLRRLDPAELDDDDSGAARPLVHRFGPGSGR